jgi:hypothetical protein
MFRRFTVSVRAESSLPEDHAALIEVVARKRRRKKYKMREEERTVADLIDAIAANLSKPKKQKVSMV